MATTIKEEHKDIILDSIAQARGFKYSATEGLLDPETDEIITNDPNKIAKDLLGQTATYKDLELAERIINYIKKLPNYDELVESARQAGLDLPENKYIETYQPGTTDWMRHIMDICK